MRKYTFGWEIQTLLEQFIGAFNDVSIKRYDKTKNQVGADPIKVAYVYAPKQRVFNGLKNPAPGGLIVPVIAVSINGISRDQQRVFNKNDSFNIYHNPLDNSGTYLKNILQPVPINIGVNMTIITKYQNDMDQILSNFIPYCDPYIVISWKLPFTDNTNTPYEIRSEILWSGTTNIQYPTDLAATQPFRITADTSFTIKGWLFKKLEEPVGKIYTIQSDYFADETTPLPESESLIQNLEDYFCCPC